TNYKGRVKTPSRNLSQRLVLSALSAGAVAGVATAGAGHKNKNKNKIHYSGPEEFRSDDIWFDLMDQTRRAQRSRVSTTATKKQRSRSLPANAVTNLTPFCFTPATPSDHKRSGSMDQWIPSSTTPIPNTTTIAVNGDRAIEDFLGSRSSSTAMLISVGQTSLGIRIAASTVRISRCTATRSTPSLTRASLPEKRRPSRNISTWASPPAHPHHQPHRRLRARARPLGC